MSESQVFVPNNMHIIYYLLYFFLPPQTMLCWRKGSLSLRRRYKSKEIPLILSVSTAFCYGMCVGVRLWMSIILYTRMDVCFGLHHVQCGISPPGKKKHLKINRGSSHSSATLSTLSSVHTEKSAVWSTFCAENEEKKKKK